MNRPYDIARYRMLTKAFDWLLPVRAVAWVGPPDFVAGDLTIGDIKLRGHVQAGYSLPVTLQVATPDGTAQTNAVVIPTPTAGVNIAWLTLVVHNATTDLSDLIMFIDQATGLPFDSNGLDIVLQPDWSLNQGWFRP